MKTLIISIIILIILGVGGYLGYQYWIHLGGSTATQSVNANITKTGVVQKLPKPGDDYTHMLKTADSLIKLNSYTVSLDQYADKTVTVIGQYSGNTLFVDSVK